jgi:hypothetical protein
VSERQLHAVADGAAQQQWLRFREGANNVIEEMALAS